MEREVKGGSVEAVAGEGTGWRGGPEQGDQGLWGQAWTLGFRSEETAALLWCALPSGAVTMGQSGGGGPRRDRGGLSRGRDGGLEMSRGTWGTEGV